MSNKTSHLAIKNRMILLGIGAATLYWFFEAILDALIFQKGSFIERFFPSDPNELWMRLVVVCLFLGLSIYAGSAMEKLRKSEKKYKTLYNIIPGMVYRARSSRPTEVISNSEAICGYPPEDINSKKVKWFDIIHPDDRERVLSEASKLEEKSSTTIQEYRIIAKDGGVRWVEDHKTSILTEKGVFDGVDGVVFDITARKQAEDKLLWQFRRNQEILKTSIDGFCVIGPDGKLLEVNSSVCDITGYSKEELLRMKLTDIDVLETAEQTAQHIDKIIKQGYDRFETKHLCKDGKIIDVEVSSQYCDFGEDRFFFSFFRDITERKMYKERVLKAQRHAYIGSMGAIVAHQVNQPLTMINILLDRAIDNAGDGPCCPAVVKDVKESLGEAQKAASIIRKFRQYSKNSALEGTGKVNVSAVADRIISVLSERARQAKMRIAIKDLRDLPEVETNETALEQIFLIIIQNAIEAADNQKQHKLDISGKIADDNIELQFADDCCGIAPENIDKIFEPFFTTKTEDKGMGLGLDIVRQILISYGGEIRVESQLGKGTTFYVTLPVGNALERTKNNES